MSTAGTAADIGSLTGSATNITSDTGSLSISDFSYHVLKKKVIYINLTPTHAIPLLRN